jgi:hypothetical protein
MNNNLTAGDGFDVAEPGGGNLIIGRMVKFNNGSYYIDKTEMMPLGTTLVVVNVTTLWIKWQDGRPVERRITYPGQTHPDKDDLPDRDESSWELSQWPASGSVEGQSLSALRRSTDRRRLYLHHR